MVVKGRIFDDDDDDDDDDDGDDGDDDDKICKVTNLCTIFDSTMYQNYYIK